VERETERCHRINICSDVTKKGGSNLSKIVIIEKRGRNLHGRKILTTNKNQANCKKKKKGKWGLPEKSREVGKISIRGMTH